MTDDTDLWFRRLRPAPEAASRLVCFPYAGGSAGVYRPLANRLWPHVEVLGVQYPGRLDRRTEPPVRDVVALAGRIAAALPRGDGVPTAFFGHSMGAVVGYEVARRLAGRPGPVPNRFFASGRRAPSLAGTPYLHHLDDDGLAEALLRLGGTDARLLTDPELRQLIVPVIRADAAATEGYRHPPGPVLSCPITVLAGESDPLAAADQLHAWAAHTTARVRVELLPGGHFYGDAGLVEVAGTILRDLAVPV